MLSDRLIQFYHKQPPFSQGFGTNSYKMIHFLLVHDTNEPMIKSAILFRHLIRLIENVLFLKGQPKGSFLTFNTKSLYKSYLRPSHHSEPIKMKNWEHPFLRYLVLACGILGAFAFFGIFKAWFMTFNIPTLLIIKE